MYYSWGHSFSTGTICEILRDSYHFLTYHSLPMWPTCAIKPGDSLISFIDSSLSTLILPPFFNYTSHSSVPILNTVLLCGTPTSRWYWIAWEGAKVRSSSLPQKLVFWPENKLYSEQYPCSHRKTNTCKALPYVQNYHDLMDFPDSLLEYQVVHYNNMQAFPFPFSLETFWEERHSFRTLFSLAPYLFGTLYRTAFSPYPHFLIFITCSFNFFYITISR